MQKNKLEIIFENDQFVAINKPSGMLTIPDRHDEILISLYKLLEKKYQKIFIVHRLDRETSGIILFAKDEATHRYLSGLFEQRNIQKFYLGIGRWVKRKDCSITTTAATLCRHPVQFPVAGLY